MFFFDRPRPRRVALALLPWLMLCGCSRPKSENAAAVRPSDTATQAAEERIAEAAGPDTGQVNFEEAFDADALAAPSVASPDRQPTLQARTHMREHPMAMRTMESEAAPAIESAPMAMVQPDVMLQPNAMAVPPPALAIESPELAVDRAAGEPAEFAPLPAGAKRTEQGYATVQVFYATDRARDSLPLSAYEVTGQKQTFQMLAAGAGMLFFVSVIAWFRGRTRMGSVALVTGCGVGMMAALIIVLGQANIEKHGVTYTGDRGTLTHGICEVTVPDSHQRGVVERPSLLRFEFREDQQEHVVLTSATELAASDFKRRLAETVSHSPQRDLLVFIHGYNVDFQSAVRRTAQVAVDLPFEGVPVCYSWPSQGTLVGYTVDENNAAWTTTHLTDFLTQLANESGARSINVVAHSMGNRPMTAAMEQIRWRRDEELDTPFDRVVLAAPDVDADRFRRDLAPSLLQVANQVTLYASSDDRALIASKKVHGYPRAGESGVNLVVVPGVETIDVSGIDLSLLGHSYYGDNESMLRDLYEVIRSRLPAPRRALLTPLQQGHLTYWQLAQHTTAAQPSVR